MPWISGNKRFILEKILWESPYNALFCTVKNTFWITLSKSSRLIEQAARLDPQGKALLSIMGDIKNGNSSAGKIINSA